MDSRVGGNPWLLCSFSVITLRHSRVGRNPWLLCSFFMIILSHSHIGGNPLNTTHASQVGKSGAYPTPWRFPFPRFVKLLVRIAKLPSPMFPHPVFQVTGHVCVERFLGFVAHDVERGLSHDCAPLWIPAFAGMTGKACADGGNPLNTT